MMVFTWTEGTSGPSFPAMPRAFISTWFRKFYSHDWQKDHTGASWMGLNERMEMILNSGVFALWTFVEDIVQNELTWLSSCKLPIPIHSQVELMNWEFCNLGLWSSLVYFSPLWGTIYFFAKIEKNVLLHAQIRCTEIIPNKVHKYIMNSSAKKKWDMFVPLTLNGHKESGT